MAPAGLFNDLDEVKNAFDRDLSKILPEGVEAHVDHFLSLDDPNAKLVASVKVNGTVGSATARRLLIPGFFFSSRAQTPFVNEEHRIAPVDMRYASREIDQVVYHLSPGLKIEGAPNSDKIPWADKAIFETKAVQAPNQITLARSLARGFTTVESSQYQDLRAFYQKIASSDQQQLVLSISQDQKGN